MALQFDALMEQIDGVLTGQGLYKQVTFPQIIIDLESYDPNIGEYSKTTNVNHAFNAVVLSEVTTNEVDSQYGITLEIIVLFRNISFTPEVEQIYYIDGVPWLLSRSTLSPENTIYTMTLGRK